MRRKPSLDSPSVHAAVGRGLGGKGRGGLAGGDFTPSPTLARSPAMHEGFRYKDQSQAVLHLSLTNKRPWFHKPKQKRLVYGVYGFAISVLGKMHNREKG